MSMPHPNMPNINRYNTVPPNIYQRNCSMPHMQYQSNQIPMQYNNPISPHIQYTNQTFSPNHDLNAHILSHSINAQNATPFTVFITISTWTYFQWTTAILCILCFGYMVGLYCIQMDQ